MIIYFRLALETEIYCSMMYYKIENEQYFLDIFKAFSRISNMTANMSFGIHHIFNFFKQL